MTSVTSLVSLESLLQERAALVSRFLDSHFASEAVASRLAWRRRSPSSRSASVASSFSVSDGDGKLPAGLRELLDSVRYSTLQEGGKRFRPALAILTAEALGSRGERVLPLAAAVECIHTYSLIHDDLPAMDNDDFRRGQPTNHKKFGEATAILAGDALLTEAFLLIAGGFEREPDVAVRVIAELSKASGIYGMVGGQAIDMKSKTEAVTLEELRAMHQLKTGALIRVSAVGAAILSRASENQLNEIETYADHLGLAFQVADDLLDFDPARPEAGSYPTLLGPEKTRAYLDELTEICLSSLREWPTGAEPLRGIALYNQRRLK